jgi:hypothetical protein
MHLPETPDKADATIAELAFAEIHHDDAPLPLARALEATGLSRARIAVDEAALDVQVRDQLARSFLHVHLVDGRDLLYRIRAVKTTVEIERLSV